LKYIFDMF